MDTRYSADTQLIYEAYNTMPPQCPPHLLEEGLSHQLHAWVFGKALPWLQANKGKVAAAGGVAAALAAYMGMDPGAAAQVTDSMGLDILNADQWQSYIQVMDSQGYDMQEIATHLNSGDASPYSSASEIALDIQDAVKDGSLSAPSIPTTNTTGHDF